MPRLRGGFRFRDQRKFDKHYARLLNLVYEALLQGDNIMVWATATDGRETNALMLNRTRMHHSHSREQFIDEARRIMKDISAIFFAGREAVTYPIYPTDIQFYTVLSEEGQ